MSIKIQQNTIGADLIFSVVRRDEANATQPMDISAATVKNIVLKYGTTALTRAATFNTNGVDGKLKYTTVTGDFNQSGTWKAQVYVEVGSAKLPSSIQTIVVEKNL